MKLIAAISDGNYHDRYYDEQIISSYNEAIMYFRSKNESIDFEDQIVFFKFDKSTSLPRILSNFGNYYREYDDIYFSLENVQEYYGIKIPIYENGIEIKISDKVRIKSDDLFWMYDHNCDYYDAEITSIISPHFIKIKINNIEIPKEHYKVQKIG